MTHEGDAARTVTDTTGREASRPTTAKLELLASKHGRSRDRRFFGRFQAHLTPDNICLS
jgi:hypothetical protein